jgi:hypothetical protein
MSQKLVFSVKGPNFQTYLNVVDVVAVPGGIKELVTKSHDKDVLDHLLSKVVVDTENFLFLPVGVESFLEIARALEVLAKGFLDL